MVLPIKKQYRIMDMIRKKVPVRKIAKKEHVSPTTVEDYKKHRPPFYRKDPRGLLFNPPPASWLEERDRLIKKDNESKQRENYLTGANNRLINDNEKLKKEKETFEQALTKKDEQISQITKTNKENLEKLAKPFDMLKEALPGIEAMRKENYDLKLKELERKKDEDIAKINSAARATQSSLEDNRKPPKEPVDEDLDVEKENKNSPPLGMIALVAGLAGSGIVLQWRYGGTINNPFSNPSQKIEPKNILYCNQTNQMKNITQPGIHNKCRGLNLGPGTGLWILIPSYLKNYIRKT